jgi:hypothetical protein
MIQGSNTGSEYQMLELIDRYGSLTNKTKVFALVKRCSFSVFSCLFIYTR